MNRAAPLLLVAGLLVGCASGGGSPSRSGLGQLFSTEAALRYALSDVCVPAILNGQAPEALALRPQAMAVDATDNGGSPGERVWFTGSGVYVYADQLGNCTVRTCGGDARTQDRIVAEILSTGGFTTAPQSPPGNARMDRRLLCRVGPPTAGVLVSVRRDGAADTPPVQVSVFAVGPGSESRCQTAP